MCTPAFVISELRHNEWPAGKFGGLLCLDLSFVLFPGHVVITGDDVRAVRVFLLQLAGDSDHISGIHGHYHRQTTGQMQGGRSGVSLCVHKGLAIA